MRSLQGANCRGDTGHSRQIQTRMEDVGPSRVGPQTWFGQQGKMLGTVGRVRRTLANMRTSRMGHGLAAQRSEPGARGDLWVVDLTQGSQTRLTADPALDYAPATQRVGATDPEGPESGRSRRGCCRRTWEGRLVDQNRASRNPAVVWLRRLSGLMAAG